MERGGLGSERAGIRPAGGGESKATDRSSGGRQKVARKQEGVVAGEGVKVTPSLADTKGGRDRSRTQTLPFCSSPHRSHPPTPKE